MTDIILSEVLDTARYGWEFEGVNNYPSSLTGAFQGGGPKIIRFQGFDIDNTLELEVFLNDASIGFAPRARGVIGPEVNIAIPAKDQLAGENVIRWQKSSIGDDSWGVTNIQLVEGEPGAIMMVRNKKNAGDKPGTWRAGEITSIRDPRTLFGFLEMPLNIVSDRSVEEINATPAGNIPLYGTTRVTNSGVITYGNTPDVGVFAGDVVVNQQNDIMVSYGNRQNLSPGDWFHIYVTDRTVAEVILFTEQFNKKLEFESNQFDPATDLRRFTTTNIRVSASGRNGFTEQGIQDVLTNWNDQYPDNLLTLVDTDNLTFFQCDGIMPVELFDEYQDITQQFAFGDLFERRRWKVIQQGLDAIANQDPPGQIKGTAAEVLPFLRDGLLD